MKKVGLIGHPIAHSLSPALFKAGYDGRYTYDLIEEEAFDTAYARFLDGYDGIHVFRIGLADSSHADPSLGTLTAPVRQCVYAVRSSHYHVILRRYIQISEARESAEIEPGDTDILQTHILKTVTTFDA